MTTTAIKNPATDKQVAFIRKLIAERFVAGVAVDASAAVDAGLSKREASSMIDALMAIPRPRPPVVEVDPTAPVDGLDLRPLEAFTSRGLVRVAVPGGDTRLKLRVKFARNGTTYVDDAAVYGEGRNYGSQAPGSAYRGEVVDELAAVLADPAAAIVRYTELTGACGICNRPLEQADSVAAGIGPVCRRKLGL